jgi:hypothetical protein
MREGLGGNKLLSSFSRGETSGSSRNAESISFANEESEDDDFDQLRFPRRILDRVHIVIAPLIQSGGANDRSTVTAMRRFAWPACALLLPRYW